MVDRGLRGGGRLAVVDIPANAAGDGLDDDADDHHDEPILDRAVNQEEETGARIAELAALGLPIPDVVGGLGHEVMENGMWGGGGSIGQRASERDGEWGRESARASGRKWESARTNAEGGGVGGVTARRNVIELRSTLAMCSAERNASAIGSESSTHG